MEAEILQGFIKQAEDYLPTIRGGILICAQHGNTFGELDNALRQIVALKEASLIVGFDEIAEILTDIEERLIVFSGLKQPMTDRQSRDLLDKITRFEVLPTKINFSADDFSDNIADFVEESFGQFEFNLPEKQNSTEAANFEIDDDIFSEKEVSGGEFSVAEEEEFEIDEEMLEIFSIEAEDLVRSISVNLEILVEKPNDREALMEIRRNAHTLKGSAGIIGLKKLSEVAHKVEDLLDFLADNNIDGDDKIFELLLTSSDCFAALASGEDSEQLNGKIARIYADFDKIMASLKKEAEQNSDVSEINLPDEVSSPVVVNETTENQMQNAANQSRSVVRVSLEKLDDLAKIVSDLVISRSVFEQRLSELEQQINELHNSTRRLQSSTNKLEIDFEADMLLQVPNSKFQVPSLIRFWFLKTLLPTSMRWNLTVIPNFIRRPAN